MVDSTIQSKRSQFDTIVQTPQILYMIVWTYPCVRKSAAFAERQNVRSRAIRILITLDETTYRVVYTQQSRKSPAAISRMLLANSDQRTNGQMDGLTDQQSSFVESRSPIH